MASNTIYLITGANRGIGLGLTSLLLSRPNTTVVATVRDKTTSTTSLLALPKAPGSELIIAYLSISTTSALEIESAHKALAEDLETRGINRLDVLIANAGNGTSFKSAADTDLEDVVRDFHTNTLAPLSLYQTLLPLLQRSKAAKFIIIGSILGSITSTTSAPCLGYGISKTGTHYIAAKIHHEEEKMVVLVVHPGWVQTSTGQKFADSIGVEMPPMGVEDSARGVVEQIDKATKETISGCFVGWDGEVVPW
ncbi:NAD(P)-binding Rossmann-fold containing protein [Glarea lozoyensis ATCC 20868]|uniref:NAD(P)-binding Rossmann-fold containing protein n=1 Tax=Glarea lozoyensis (strain ATCC 20868 / MF5171) TaxID=1116229 RepID=S3DN07_GLAL2|nr:NAD(P)-binding Rossmann-fold containing protein [Glarea lozoyensis ATCC 20868]EPE33481.1 NAD(P)-binding Rossmann-fold containing protein [Glarea lozoyensis ATCC 20868]